MFHKSLNVSFIYFFVHKNVYVYFKIIKSVSDILLFNQNWNYKGSSVCKIIRKIIQFSEVEIKH